jgi:hypothetical protein
MTFARAFQRPGQGAPRKRCGAPGLVLALLAACGVAGAQPARPLSPADRTFLERLALGRARAGLYDQVGRLALKPRLTVAAWAAQNVARDRALRLWIRSRPRVGTPRLYSDETCDVDVCLPPDELATQLITLLETAGPAQDGPLTATDIAQAARRWPILWSTGSASLTEKTRRGKPPGWEEITPEGIQLARNAAVADAIHALLEEAAELKLTPAHRLREFLESSDDVLEAVYEAVRNEAGVTVVHAPEQVAVAEARLGMTDLIRILTTVHQRHYRGDRFHAPDFREMALDTQISELRAQGLATPPNRYRQPEPYELIELDAPSWSGSTLSATGVYDPLDSELFAPEVRLELARFDGMDKLRQKVEALVIKDGVTVEQLLGYRRELKDDVVVFLGGTRIVGPPRTEPDGTLKVPVELPLKRLWLIVRRGMEPVEVDPPAEARPTQPPGEGARP